MHPLHHPLTRLVAALCFLVATLSSAPAAVPGTGLTGEYFDNSDFSTLRATRIDPVVDFNWGAGAPTNTMGADTFSVRWSGQIEPAFSETYLFHVTADDGARLWVNNRLLFARTTYSAAALEMCGRINLVAGQRYNIVLEFIEGSGNAQVQLAWSSPSQPKQIIPQERLYPTLATPEAGSILAETWLNLPGTNLAALTSAPNYPARPDGREFLTSFETLQPDWAEDYGMRVSGYLLPPRDGTYTFAVAGAHATQLFLSPDTNPASKQLIASNNTPTGLRQFNFLPGQVSAPIALNAHTKYYVELLHKAGTGSDHFAAAWIEPGASNFTVIPASALIPAGLDRAAPAQNNYLDTLAGSHPRLLASSQRFEWLKRTLASNSVPQLTSWWATVSNSASSMLSQPVNVYNQDVRGTILAVSRSVLDRMYKLGLAWRMTGNPIFAERAWAELEQVASTNFPDWHPAHFLDTAEMTHACAIGYDWLYDYWAQPRRDTIRTAIITKGLTPSLTLYTNNSSWVASSANNWNLVCNGGMILGALAIGAENEPLAEYVLFKAVASARLVMRHYTTDNGGWYEGPGYWDYTTDYNMRLMAGLESALGSDFGLSAVSSVWETGLNPIYMVGPLKLSFNYADGGAGNMRGPQLFWLARRYGRPEFSWHERNNASVEPLDLLWYDARGSDPQTTGLQPDNYFRGPTGTTPYAPADALTLRSRWQDTDATFVGTKSGELGASHGNLDAGSFVLDALGVRWAHDLGGDDYALPGYFGSQRWTYYRMRAEGHNTLVINPGSNADQTVGAKPPVILYTSEPNAERSAVVMDLTSAYSVSKVWRGIQLLRNRRWVLVQDEIRAGAPANVWWFMHIHTNSAVTIDPSGASAMLTQGSDRLWVRILQGGGSLAVSNAVPLPTSPNPAGQNPNANYRKLAVNLTNVTDTTLAVLFVPLYPAEIPPTNFPPILPLADWGAADTNAFGTVSNQPPVAVSAQIAAGAGTYRDIDLRALASDVETPADRLVFTVFQPANGTVSLLADGHTARFSPSPGFTGLASFQFTVADTWPDARLMAHFDFEPPEDTLDGAITDRSSRAVPGILTTVGSGTNYLSTDTPPQLGSRSTQSLLLREAGDFNGSRLVASVYPADLDFNRDDWTLSAWFKRVSTTNDDFLFYIGNSDGFGSPDEFQVYGPSGQNSLALRHYIATTTTDADLSVAGVIPNQWYHAAVTFRATSGNTGEIAFYLNGNLAGSDSSVTLNMVSGSSAVFGGHMSSTFAVNRWFNGLIDDAAIFRGALSAQEISRLISLPAAYLGGARATNTVFLNVLPPNHPPAFASPFNLTTIAGAQLLWPVPATDPDSPPQRLTFTLLSAPPGATIDPGSGVISWRPAVAQAGTTGVFQVVATEGGWLTNLAPEADAYVRDGSYASLNFGSDPLLTVKLGASGLARESYLRFPAPLMPGSLAEAVLQLTPVATNFPAVHLLGVVTNDTWSESSLTWNNRPASSTVLAGWTAHAGVPIQVPLTSLYAQEQVGDGLISLRIYATNTTSDGRVDYASRENSPALAPRLMVTSTNWSALGSTQTFLVSVLAAQPPRLVPAGIHNGAFHLRVSGDAGPDYTVQVSTNLLQWTTLLTTNPFTVPFTIADPISTNWPARFYRALLGP